MMSSGGMVADFEKVKRRTRRVYKRIKNSKHAELYTQLDTDLSLALKGRNWITEDTGMCRRKGVTANGRLIIDGAFAGKLRKHVIEVKNGSAERINNSREAGNYKYEPGG